MKISPEQQLEHAAKLQQYLALTDKPELAKAILAEELRASNGDFDQAIMAATRRIRIPN